MASEDPHTLQATIGSAGNRVRVDADTYVTDISILCVCIDSPLSIITGK